MDRRDVIAAVLAAAGVGTGYGAVLIVLAAEIAASVAGAGK